MAAVSFTAGARKAQTAQTMPRAASHWVRAGVTPSLARTSMPCKPAACARSAVLNVAASSSACETRSALIWGVRARTSTRSSSEKEIQKKRSKSTSRCRATAAAACRASAPFRAPDSLSSVKQYVPCDCAAKSRASSNDGRGVPANLPPGNHAPTSAPETSAASRPETGRMLSQSASSHGRRGHVAVRQSVSSWSTTRVSSRRSWMSHSKPSATSQARANDASVFSGRTAEAPRCPIISILRARGRSKTPSAKCRLGPASSPGQRGIEAVCDI
mmetsp:Transcript_24969/g.85575  ORF Transcript_24969/g.85575 Transcript_24969/m.85575 type:complete len:273 (-) Transcript_24969:94-912(-)